MSISFEEFSLTCQRRIDHLIDEYLVKRACAAPQLKEAMFYAMSNGGKRMRPLCVYAIGALFEVPWEVLDVPAFAIELIHGFSLIHDDLPAMDNAEMRRGKPSCHKAFGEAMAILAGDALQTLAFEVLVAHPAPLSADKRAAMVKTLAEQSGLNGMTGGQAIDMLGTHSLEGLVEMYSLKTGALGSACLDLGLIAAGKTTTPLANHLKKCITYLGLAFQIQDDLLDEKGTLETTGKCPHIDLANKKVTYPSLTGLTAAEAKVKELFGSALKIIETIGQPATLLYAFAKNMAERSK